jgi:hypothetical protein
VTRTGTLPTGGMLRGTILLGAALVLAAAAFLCRWQVRSPVARPVSPDELTIEVRALESGPEVAPSSNSDARQAAVRETRFDPLPAEPREIQVHVEDKATEERVAGAEVFVLEVEQDGWLESGGLDGGPILDVESRLRTLGQQMESDERGDLKLPIPARYLAVSARKEGRFGMILVGFESEPEFTLRIVPSSTCRVRVSGPTGLPASGVPVVLGIQDYDGFWRMPSDSAGEVVVPNLGWMVAEHGWNVRSWYVAAEETSVEPILRRYAIQDTPPDTIQLTLADTQRLRVRIAASDGTPVPVEGRIVSRPRSGAGNAARLHLPSCADSSAPIVRGAALVPCAERGSRLWVRATFGENASFDTELRAPPSDEEESQVQLRMPESLQVVYAHLTDETGAKSSGTRSR